MAKNYSWYVCPACRSRLAVERGVSGEIRCRNCSTLIRPAKESANAAAKQADAPRHDGSDDEYQLAPLTDQKLVPPSNPAQHRQPPVYNSELERLRDRRQRLDENPVSDPAPAASNSPQPFVNLEIRDDQRYPAAPPPRWTFFSGVLTYPWRPQSMLPWVALSVGIALCSGFGLLMISGLLSNSREGVVMAGFLALALLWLLILTGSYAAACLFSVTETTAYNYDEPYDWPDPDWRERFMHLLWLGWCFGLAISLMIGPATMSSESVGDRLLVIAIGVGVLFPIFVLSTLETNSLWPLSAPVWKSLITESFTWISFYVLAALVVGSGAAVSAVLLRRMGLISALVLGPLWAAAILIYARLLGRLAWRIMQPGEAQLRAWRRAHHSTLAGDSRRREQEQEGNIFAD